MPKPKIQPSQRYGRVVVLERGSNSDQHKSRWCCLCDCGTTTLLLAATLTTHPNPSCGCEIKERRPTWARTHGHSVDRKVSSTYGRWGAMLKRCDNPASEAYKNYGGRGITYCDRWKVFENFLADMGEAPEGMTIERLDVNGNYEPGNCVWADRYVQGANRQNQTRWMVDAQLMTQSQARRHWKITRKQTHKELRKLPIHEGRVPDWYPSHIKKESP